MTTYDFTLILDGDIEAHIDELFEAGCDDATVGTIAGVPHASFAREAGSLLEAVRSAVADVRKVPGITVTRVEFDEPAAAWTPEQDEVWQELRAGRPPVPSALQTQAQAFSFSILSFEHVCGFEGVEAPPLEAIEQRTIEEFGADVVA